MHIESLKKSARRATPTDKPAIEEKIKNGEVKVNSKAPKVRPKPGPEPAAKSERHPEKNFRKSKAELPEGKFAGTINAYNFLHLNSKLMEAFGAKVGEKTAVILEVQGDTLIISKA